MTYIGMLVILLANFVFLVIVGLKLAKLCVQRFSFSTVKLKLTFVLLELHLIGEV